MVYADLHVHTRLSDGTLTLETIPDAAEAAGVEVVGVTDHDRFHPDFDGPVVERDGVTLIHGIELRVEAADGRVDLLGYGLERTDALQAEVERIQRDRRKRGRAIVECVEDRLGIDLDVEIREGLGRPHVARAIEDHPETDLDYDAAFDELIGNDGPFRQQRRALFRRAGRPVVRARPVAAGGRLWDRRLGAPVPVRRPRVGAVVDSEPRRRRAVLSVRPARRRIAHRRRRPGARPARHGRQRRTRPYARCSGPLR